MFQKYEIKYSEDCYIPTTAADIHRLLTEGKHSVYKNLPCPPVDSIGEGCAYVSLYDIIEYAFSDPKMCLVHYYHYQPHPTVRRLVERNY